MEDIYTKFHLSYDEQLEDFISRGMKVKDKDYCIKKLENINFYKLKEFASPYSRLESNSLAYEDVYLEHIISRFYADKNLRVYFLHALEKIETSLKTKISFVLGEKLGAFGYLDLIGENNSFKSSIIKKIEETNNIFIQEFKGNHPDEKFIPIWLAIEIMSFDDIIMIYNLMTEEDKSKISNFYNSTPEEFDSWLPLLNILKNRCANNLNIIDMEFNTLPLIRNEWRVNLGCTEDGNFINKLGISLVILKFLVPQISSDYFFGNIVKSFYKLMKAKTTNPSMYGLVDRNLEFLLK